MIRLLVLLSLNQFLSRIVVPTNVHPVNQPQDNKRNNLAMNSVMECQVILKSIRYPLFEVEVYFHNGVILFYLEVEVGWMHDFQ